MLQVDANELRQHQQHPLSLVFITSNKPGVVDPGVASVVRDTAHAHQVPAVAWSVDDPKRLAIAVAMGAVVVPSVLVFRQGELWDCWLVREASDLAQAITHMQRGRW
jgi:hypothetical protein